MQKLFSPAVLLAVVPFFCAISVYAKSATDEAQQSIAAEDSSATPSKKIVNLVYYPHRNHFLVSAVVQSSATSTSTVSDDTGSLTDSVLTFTRLGLDAAYGITDRLRVGVEINQLIEQDNVSVSDTDGTANDHVSRGLSDPQIEVAYRLIEDANKHLYTDLVLTTDTSFGPAVTATGGQSGNNKTGAWASQLSVPVYWLVSSNELELAPSLNRNFGGRETGTTERTDRSDENYWSVAALLRDRIHLTDVFFLQPTVVFNFEHAYNSNDKSAHPAQRNVRVPFYPELQINAGYVITPWCLLDLFITYDGYDSKTATNGVTRQDDISNVNFAIRTSFTF